MRNQEAYARDVLVPRFRESYVPVVEYYSWAPGQWADMSPDEEEWLSGQGNYRESKSGIRTFIRLCHEAGIAVVTYAQTAYHGPIGFDWAREHPQWISYDHQGRPSAFFDVGEVEKQRNPRPKDSGWYGTFGGGSVWALDDGAVDHQARELVKASEMFGFDGVRWDGHPVITPRATMPDANVPTAAYDYKGRPITDLAKDPDATTARINRRIIDHVSKAIPNYLFGYNWAPEYSGVVWPKVMPKTWHTLVPDAYLLDEDLNTRGQGGSADPNNLWSRYAQRVRRSVGLVKPYGGYHYSGAIVAGSHVFGVQMMGLLFAASSRAAYVNPHDFSLDYARFGLRYGNLLFGNDVTRVTQDVEKVASVKAPRTLWWRDYVYKRKMAGGRRWTIVHLLNPPVKPYMDYNETRAPAPQPNVTVSAAPPGAGRRCLRAWVLSPDARPMGATVPTQQASGQTMVTVPCVRYWTTVVFVWAKGSKP